jgi:hypothetical protein
MGGLIMMKNPIKIKQFVKVPVLCMVEMLSKRLKKRK